MEGSFVGWIGNLFCNIISEVTMRHCIFECTLCIIFLFLFLIEEDMSYQTLHGNEKMLSLK